MSETTGKKPGPEFNSEFRTMLEELFRWRRDVRHFQTTPIDPKLLNNLISIAALAPSVGHSQPWRFVKVETEKSRALIRANFERANAEALAGYTEERAQLYATLKLHGLDEAPVHLAVFQDTKSHLGDGLGAKTMPETLTYSVVGAINILWLAARSHGIGLGWVSILDPDAAKDDLGIPKHWKLIGYLCIGYPKEDQDMPELHRTGWQKRLEISNFIIER
ncbi:MAG: 5,6-dimethylbenzimidazole synthase [Rhodospirillaceae bacterium TMED8]|nr:5,6-dimethylbenzimidazole synthase [Magnetovibrio sp.]OUT50942.1 MAG: 5,6-dimethylbenzimidazole synthase [Rhodospirillaceae bacterium TMED8]